MLCGIKGICEMKYDAFISYRHAPLDMEIAKKVHTGLETYHVPGAVRKKTGKKKKAPVMFLRAGRGVTSP